MRTPSPAWPAALALAALCPSCTEPVERQLGSRTKPKGAPIQTNVAKLGRIVTLPRPPLGALWQHEQIGDGVLGPSDFRVVAVLKFAPRDSAAIIASARRRAASQAGRSEVLPWFPAPVRKAARKNGDGRLFVSGESLDAGDFHKMSLINGSLLRVAGTPYFVLSLHTT